MPSEHLTFTTIAERFAWNLKIARQRSGLTQRGLAKRMKKRQAQIAAWECAEYLPKAASIVRLAEALDIEPGELLRETKGLAS